MLLGDMLDADVVCDSLSSNGITERVRCALKKFRE